MLYTFVVLECFVVVIGLVRLAKLVGQAKIETF